MLVNDTRPQCPVAAGRSRSRSTRDKPPQRTCSHGFSLIELLIVIAVIALLLSVLVPSLGAAKESARRVVCQQNLRQAHLGFELYREDHADVYPAAKDPISQPPEQELLYWLWSGRGFRDVVGPYIMRGINQDNPSVLLCPSDKTDPDRFQRTSFAYSTAFFYSQQQIDSFTDRFDILPFDRATAPEPHGQRSSNVRFPGDKILSGEWESHHARLEDDQGWWDTRGARNFVFADGHVEAVATERMRLANDGLPDPNLTVGGIRGRDR